MLRNVTKTASHWIELRLVGDTAKRSPRDAIGAIAYVTTGKLRQRQDVISGAKKLPKVVAWKSVLRS